MSNLVNLFYSKGSQKSLKSYLSLITLILTLFVFLPIAQASEAELILPDLASVSFLGYTGRELLMAGLGVCALGLIFGLVVYSQIKKLPVHQSMKEISE